VKRILLLICLVLFGGGGCVVIPDKTVARPSAAIGSKASAPLKVGSATREQVLARLGIPRFSSQHDLAFGYVNQVRIGDAYGVLFGMCSMPYGVGKTAAYDDDDVWMEFDQRGVLKRYVKNLMGPFRSDSEAWAKFMLTVPDSMRPPSW
jgi:outer membrane protein assembly factor BamE (lipoprotein component of BamABCDE complex)